MTTNRQPTPKPFPEEDPMPTILEHLVLHDLLPDRLYADGFAEAWAVYKAALARVRALDPERFGRGQGITLLGELDEAAVALADAAWAAGARVGDAFARAECRVQPHQEHADD